VASLTSVLINTSILTRKSYIDSYQHMLSYGFNEAMGTFLFVSFYMIVSKTQTSFFSDPLIVILLICIVFYLCLMFTTLDGGFMNTATTMSIDIVRTVFNRDVDCLIRLPILIMG